MSSKTLWSTPKLTALDSGSESFLFKKFTWKEGIFITDPVDDEGDPEGPS